MTKGKIDVTADNIFPIIKKFLYSDHEIFLREITSNAVDASKKLNVLSTIGEFKGDIGDLTIEIKVDKDGKKLHVIDKGIGMTEEEVKKYINQVAFSGAKEFVNLYKDKAEGANIIGNFGLGFYSSFMVAKKVEILTKSYKEDSKGVRWECDGSPEYTIENIDKQDRGTEIILHIADDSTEFLEESRISTLLNKYSKFLPIPIKFGTRQETKKTGEGDDAKEEKIEVDNIVNNTSPAWTKQATDLKEEDYKSFYRELYPMQFEDPLFHIHLNVDYPFNLTGILYFPRIKNNIEIQKDKIQLYQDQVFVTDNVEGIVPEFLTMLKGVIDSPDIPLNVSRSYLQSDGAVKKISGYITKKVGDKLEDLFKKDRKDFESKWDDIKVVIEYGMLSEEKFYKKAKDKYALYPTVEGEYFTFEEFKDKVKDLHKDKDGKIVLLYSSDKEAQHSYIQTARDKGYEVLLLDSPIVPHLIQKLETDNEGISFARVDSDHVDKLINKDDKPLAKLSEDEQKKLKEIIESNIEKDKYIVKIENLDSSENPFIITLPEFMRRMKEMQQVGGGGMIMGNMPDMYNVVVNANHPLISNLSKEKEDRQKELISHMLDLARLSQNLLQGKELTDFINRNYKMIK
ncbi:molecular chaperone HtpG [Ichthyobacterium seriolicida]|uniref:Chaperone protein HtpG n=1 Tax=Ichthyobacterium seriolicida TaxID=242600 RepID=A0A1J1DXN2_9FLAO|nr:molecular chaperone HtpG [Ichthyobacterium seriolicida]BAV94623.1 chaperone protein HtpG [Ichthyobacterium seriolicida]